MSDTHDAAFLPSSPLHPSIQALVDALRSLADVTSEAERLDTRVRELEAGQAHDLKQLRRQLGHERLEK